MENERGSLQTGRLREDPEVRIPEGGRAGEGIPEEESRGTEGMEGKSWGGDC